MKIKILLLLTISIFYYSEVKAQADHMDIVDEFFTLYAIDPVKAFDYAFSTNKWMERNQDAIDNLKNQFNNLLPLIGNYHGHEIIVEKNIGDNLKMMSFMARYERQPIRLTFVFYRSNKTWQVQNLKYDDRLSSEIEESGNQSKN